MYDRPSSQGDVEKKDSSENRVIDTSNLKKRASDLKRVFDDMTQALSSKVPPHTRIEKLRALRSPLKELDTASLLEELASLESALNHQLSRDIQIRRQDLRAEAKRKGIPVESREEYDFVDVFRVTYKGAMVSLWLEKEFVSEFSAVEGKVALDSIVAERARLTKTTPSRQSFIASLREAYEVVRCQGKSKDGYVPVHELYTTMVITRNLSKKAFRRLPTQKSFDEYPRYQFIFDLATFGAEGWSCGKWKLTTMTPNMNAVQRGHTLPLLQRLDQPGGSPKPIAMLRMSQRDA